ncbi:MAG: NUDIX hydrolase [Nitrososphaerales archaeon]
MSSAGNDLIEKIKATLLNHPGKVLADQSLPRAAVAMVLYFELANNEIRMLLVKRKTREGDPWSGHMALPGGRYSETDRHILATVIREVMEETKIDLRECSILGTLDEILPSNFSMRVTPYVALSSKKPEIELNENEIESYVWIPVSFFLNPENVESFTVGSRNFPSYNYLGNPVIWGMTFRIIQNFVSKLS